MYIKIKKLLNTNIKKKLNRKSDVKESNPGNISPTCTFPKGKASLSVQKKKKNSNFFFSLKPHSPSSNGRILRHYAICHCLTTITSSNSDTTTNVVLNPHFNRRAFYLVSQLPVERLTTTRAIVHLPANGAPPELVRPGLRTPAPSVRTESQTLSQHPTT